MIGRSIQSWSRTFTRGRLQLLPRLAAGRSRRGWDFDRRPATSEPVVGRAGGMALWLAYGHYRNGILMAPATALRVAKSLIEAS